MSDNIMKLFQGGKKSGDEGGGDFFSTSEEQSFRLELCWPGGHRASLPYGYLHEVLYVPANGGASDELRLHYPGFSAVRLLGHHLRPLYEMLCEHRVSSIREKSEKEEIADGSLSINDIHYFQLTDWEVDFDAKEQRRANWESAK